MTPSRNRKGENGNPLPKVGAPEFYPNDDLAGASPASASFPVGTVVISGDGAGDQAVGSPEVNVLVGRMTNLVSSDRRASKAAGRSASEP